MFPSEWFPCPEIHAFTSDRKAVRFAKRKYGVEIEPKGDRDGWTATLANDNGRTVCIVCVKPDASRGQEAALLAHECVHVMQRWADAMGEDRPSDELQAYMVQSAYLACLDDLGTKWLR